MIKAIPAGIWGALFVILFILAAQMGLYLFNQWYKRRNLPKSTEMAGIVFGTISLIYSLVVAFVIIAVWNDYEELNKTIEDESDKLNSIVIHSSLLNADLKKSADNFVIAYCNQVISHEWNITKLSPAELRSSISGLRLHVISKKPESRLEEEVLQTLNDNLRSLSDLRRDRLSHTHSHVPQMVWLILIAGSILTVTFSYFLTTEPEQLKRIYLSFLCAIIAMSLFLIYMLDHPFIGSSQVSKEAYQSLIIDIKN